MFRSLPSFFSGKGNNKRDPMLINFEIATFVGIWAINSKDTWKVVLYQIYHYINVGLFAILPVLEIIDIINVLGDVEKLNYNLCASAGTIMLIFKLNILMSHRLNIVGFQQTLLHYFYLPFLGTSEDKAIMKKTDIHCRNFLQLLYCMVIFTVTFWAAVPLLDSGEEGEVVTAMRMWLPFDQSKTPTYEIVCTVQAYMLYMYAGTILTIDMVFFGFSPKFCAHFEIMVKNFKRVGERYVGGESKEEDQEEERRTYRDLQHIVIHHQHLTDLALEFVAIYKPIVLMHFFGMAILLCVEVFDIVLVPHTTFTSRLAMQLCYFSSCLLDTFIYCLYGQRLANASDELVKAAYFVPWYNMSQRCKKLIFQVILKSQAKPLVMISLGGLFIINFPTFVSVIKSSYNFLAILQQMQE